MFLASPGLFWSQVPLTTIAHSSWPGGGRRTTVEEGGACDGFAYDLPSEGRRVRVPCGRKLDATNVAVFERGPSAAGKTCRACYEASGRTYRNVRVIAQSGGAPVPRSCLECDEKADVTNTTVTKHAHKPRAAFASRCRACARLKAPKWKENPLAFVQTRADGAIKRDKRWEVETPLKKATFATS
jgi:hypothetical protein